MRLVLASAAFTFLLTAPAFASDNGEGLAGETDDKQVTFAALGVLVFFVLVVIIGSTIQGVLEKRKEQRKAVELRRRVGW
jgi:hypothetical protein